MDFGLIIILVIISVALGIGLEKLVSTKKPDGKLVIHTGEEGTSVTMTLTTDPFELSDGDFITLVVERTSNITLE